MGGFAALLVGLAYLGRYRHLRLKFTHGRLRWSMDGPERLEAASAD